MSARKYNTLGNVLYIIDRKGALYINEYGKVKRSTTDFYYELMVNFGGYWKSIDYKYIKRSDAMQKLKTLAGVTE
jgi:hypothetical protein